MNSEELFKIALGIQMPWLIEKVDFKIEEEEKVLHIYIDFKRGEKFPDSTGTPCPVYDTKQKTWRHLDFFQHECYLHCRVPRITTTEGKVELIEVPWVRSGSGFTLLFEAYVMHLIENEMPMNKVGELVNEDPHRIWTIFNHWIERAYKADKPQTPEKMGIDETSRRKKHNYVALAVDLEERRVFHATVGKDKAAIKSIKDYLKSKSIDVNQVERISMDMSPSFISGVKKYFPNAEIHFDRFHVVKLLNEALNEVIKEERKEHQELKGQKYNFLRNNENLSVAKRYEVEQLTEMFPKMGEAYRLKELFNDLWYMDDADEATDFLVAWCKQVESKQITPFQDFVKTIKKHWQGIVNFCETQINNGILEGINNKVQLAKRRARGYRKAENFINMIYFLCGKLKFDYPLRSS